MSKKQRQYFLVAVHAFFLRENKVLLCERANTGYMDGYLSVPAGHVDGKEEIWKAMKREVSEEVGIQLTDPQLPSHVMHRIKLDEKEERIDYFFVLKDWQGTPHNREREKCASVAWYSVSDLPETVVPYVRKAFEEILQGRIFSELQE